MKSFKPISSKAKPTVIWLPRVFAPLRAFGASRSASSDWLIALFHLVITAVYVSNRSEKDAKIELM